jgi:SNF2 family DNA or RNA helicase
MTAKEFLRRARAVDRRVDEATERVERLRARLHRQGQEKPVIVHRLLVQGGVDEDVAKALESKDETQAALIEALKARIGRWKN